MDQIKQTEFGHFMLNSGNQLPKIGLGTINSETLEASLELAINMGYRHIDTASLYGNEEKIGNVIQKLIKSQKIKRSDLFITSKFYNNEKQNIEGALNTSLSLLQADYLDLYLMHWPGGVFDQNGQYKCVPVHKVWPVLEELVSKGKVKSIGVSNFNVQMISDLISYCNIKPSVNQIELHPYLQQKGLLDCCKIFGIQVIAYSPICRGGKREKDGKIIDCLKEQSLIDLSQKYNKSCTQIVLNWHLQKNVAVIPRSENEGRLLENLKSDEFKLEPEDIEKINALNQDLRMVLSTQKLGLDYFA